VCGREQRDADDPQALTNPVVLVEVLSPSTEEYDRGEKLDHDKKISSLKEVALLSHREPAIELWRREPAGWTCRVARAGESAHLASVGCALDVDDIYRDPLAG
jgi:Uma2 family endonuclease